MKSITNKANKKRISAILSLSILLSTPMQTLALGSKSNSSYFGIPTFMIGLKNTMLKFVGLAPKKLTPKEKFAKLILDLKNVKLSKNGKIILLSGATLTVAGFIALLVKLALNKKNTPAPTDPKNDGNQGTVNTDALKTEKSETTNNQEPSIEADSNSTATSSAPTELEKTAQTLKGNTKAKAETFENKTQEIKNSTNPEEAINPAVKKGWFKKTVDYVKAAPSKVWGWTKEKTSSAWTYTKNKFSAAKTSISGVFSAAGTKISNAAKSVYKFATTNPFKKKAAEPVVEIPEVKTTVKPEETTVEETTVEETTVEETTVEETTVVETQAVVEIPEVKTTVKPEETPVVETPVVETPVVETPVVETPVVETTVNQIDTTKEEVKKEIEKTQEANNAALEIANGQNASEATQKIVVNNSQDVIVPVEKGNTSDKAKIFEKTFIK